VRLHVTREHGQRDERGTDTERAGRHGPAGTVTRGGEATTAKPRKKPKTGEKVILPTPQEWAEEQLKNAPPRSEQWAQKVARIYCLDIGDDNEEEKAG
jgi:hypothetical protein